MPIGTVKWFDKRKGWGFITQEDGQDIFVHYSHLVGEGFRSLAQGDRVSFDIGQTEKGAQAENVVKLEEAKLEEATPEEATPEEATPEEATPEEATPEEA